MSDIKRASSRIPSVPGSRPPRSSLPSPYTTPPATASPSPAMSPQPSPRPYVPMLQVLSSRDSNYASDIPSPASSISSSREGTPGKDNRHEHKHFSGITVAVRFRPLSEREVTRGDKEAWGIDEDGNVGLIQNGRVNARYAYDVVLSKDVNNDDLYSRIGQGIIAPIMNGINGTLFAYGVTSSGKTHTITGTAEDPGIMTRAVCDVFAMVERMQNKAFLVRVAMLEIYNEVINDLLDPSRTNLRMREDVSKSVSVEGLVEEVVLNAQHALHLISTGDANRKVSATAFNDGSSRSHTICRLTIESCDRGSELQDGRATRTMSYLNIIDLAGSESAKAAVSRGHRMEGSFINKSLLTLSTVIHKLSEGSYSHIPFRDSKLTRLLQSSLSGNGAKVAIVCNITPATSHAEETSNTLKFATRAKMIKIAVSRNEIIDEKSLIKRYQQEIAALKEQLAFAAQSASSPPPLLPPSPVPQPVLQPVVADHLLMENKNLKSKLQEAQRKAANDTVTLEERIQRLTNMVLKSSAVGTAPTTRRPQIVRSKSAELLTARTPLLDAAAMPSPHRVGRHSTADARGPLGGSLRQLSSVSSSTGEVDAAMSVEGLNLRNPSWSPWGRGDRIPPPSMSGGAEGGASGYYSSALDSDEDEEKALLREQLAVLVDELGESYKRVQELRQGISTPVSPPPPLLNSSSSFTSDHDVELQVLFADREMLQDRLGATENANQRLQSSLSAALQQLEEMKAENWQLQERNRQLESEVVVRSGGSPQRSDSRSSRHTFVELSPPIKPDTPDVMPPDRVSSARHALSDTAESTDSPHTFSDGSLDDGHLARLAALEQQVEIALSEIAARDEQLSQLKAWEAQVKQLTEQNKEIQNQLVAAQGAAAEGQKIAVENQMMSGEVGRLRLATNRLQGYMLDNMSGEELGSLIATLTQAVERVRITVQSRRGGSISGQPHHPPARSRIIPRSPSTAF